MYKHTHTHDFLHQPMMFVMLQNKRLSNNFTVSHVYGAVAPSYSHRQSPRASKIFLPVSISSLSPILDGVKKTFSSQLSSARLPWRNRLSTVAAEVMVGKLGALVPSARIQWGYYVSSSSPLFSVWCFTAPELSLFYSFFILSPWCFPLMYSCTAISHIKSNIILLTSALSRLHEVAVFI